MRGRSACAVTALLFASSVAIAQTPTGAEPGSKAAKEGTAGTGAATDPAKSKPGKEGEMAAMMAAYEKAGTPGEAHKHLQKQVGKWDVTMKSWMQPNQPPMESTGTAEVKPILGDRFVQTTFTGTVQGKPFTGIGTTGYDNTKKKYVGTWIDSMSTGIMRSEGTPDASGKVITANAIGTDPLSGKESRTRIVEKWESDNKKVEEFYERKGGKEIKTMEITYTRK